METHEENQSQIPDNRGFVYVLSNIAFPGYVKIGHTRTSPFDRARDLFTTGVPEPFKVEQAWYVENSSACERAIHEKLRSVRTSGGMREFFCLPIAEAISEVEELIIVNLVPEIYSPTTSSSRKLRDVHEKNASLKTELHFLTQEFNKNSAINSSLKRQIEDISEKLDRYKEAHEKIIMVDKIIVERNHYRDKYRSKAQEFLMYALEYEKFLLNLGGRYAFWAEEQSKRRPDI